MKNYSQHVDRKKKRANTADSNEADDAQPLYVDRAYWQAYHLSHTNNHIIEAINSHCRINFPPKEYFSLQNIRNFGPNSQPVDRCCQIKVREVSDNNKTNHRVQRTISALDLCSPIFQKHRFRSKNKGAMLFLITHSIKLLMNRIQKNPPEINGVQRFKKAQRWKKREKNMKVHLIRPEIWTHHPFASLQHRHASEHHFF